MFRKMNVLLLAMFFSLCFHMGASAEVYLDEESQKVWWTGADAVSLNRKALVDFTGGVGNPGISTWTKKAAYTNLNTGPIQQGAGHYVDPMTGLDVKGLNQVYFDGPPGTGTQLGANIGAYGYDRSQPVVIGKAPQKGANYVYAFRNYSGLGTITAELYDARTSESYGAPAAPQQVGTGTQMYNRNGSSVTILPGADLSYYWVVGVDHIDNPANIVSFKVSADNPQGVSTTPVKSSLGQISGDPVEDFRNMMPWNSEMASGAGAGSPITGSVTGTSKLVIADYGSSNIYVYNFNRGTGSATLLNRLSEATTVPSGFTGYVGGSSDFSPSGQYVYFTKGALAYYGPIYRWDYAAGVVELVPGQSPTSRGSGYVQTAPNGRMYVNRGYPDYLPGFGEIANPDSALISGVGYVQDKYTFPISSTSMDGLATETIGVYVYDSGDAPASYETAVLTQGNTGITYAKHMYDYEVKLGTTNGYLLGNTRNTTNTSPYDDGVTFLKDANDQNFLKVGKPTSFTVNVSKPGYVSVWLDLDQDGTWQSANDKIVSSQLITTTGTNQQINITIPYDYVSTTSGSTWFRARYSTYQADVVNSAGWARDGEVEDYAVLIEKEDVTLTKVSPTGEYTPEQTVFYNVSIENNGEIPATGMSIQDLLSSVQALDSSAVNSAAFSSWTITAKNGAGTNIPSGGTVGGTSAGTFSNNTDLNTTVTIAASDTLTYTITATVSADIVGPIVNTANLDLNVVTSDSSRVIQTAESTLTAALPSLEISKTSSTTTYSPTGTIVYVLDIENTGTGIASDISIVDTLSSITTELANGNPGAAFSSWTISAVATGTETTTGTYSDNADLDTTIDIAVGGRVTYTITGTVVNNAIGTISNYAQWKAPIR